MQKVVSSTPAQGNLHSAGLVHKFACTYVYLCRSEMRLWIHKKALYKCIWLIDWLIETNQHTWYHLVSSSESGFLKKPPTSAPLKVIPVTLNDNNMGILIFRWDHSPVLSPVHIAPVDGLIWLNVIDWTILCWLNCWFADEIREWITLELITTTI